MRVSFFVFVFCLRVPCVWVSLKGNQRGTTQFGAPPVLRHSHIMFLLEVQSTFTPKFAQSIEFEQSCDPFYPSFVGVCQKGSHKSKHRSQFRDSSAFWKASSASSVSTVPLGKKNKALAYGCVLEYGTPRLPEMVGFALVPLQTNRAPVSGYQQKHRNGTPCELSSSTAGWGNAAPVLTGKEAGSRAKEVVVICLTVSPQQWSNRNPQKQNKFNRKPPKWSSIDSLMKIMSSKGWAKKAGGVDLGFPRTTPG